MRKPARHKVQRIPKRAHYDAATIHAIFDAACIAHVAFADSSGQPFVIPMLYAREGECLYLHGSIASRLLKTGESGIALCVCVTLVDGLVLARSHFHHSMNYRSVVAFGIAELVQDRDEKAAVLARYVDSILPGRAAESRAADRNELNATALLRFRIEHASAKIRSGGPKDDPADRELPVWSGVVPISQAYAAPQVAEDATPGIPVPDSVLRLLD
ncbi:MAG: pyridoxamine 5'-phosphate oxidase family protein [Dokdonella sp.]|jgi:nitroimidazol reductase NimA-like FMN-containing flavoprotein (pyridoxamine 5'-phosphate oxidase superfamily)|uniref:pyridoxamine 5'-phosphate oxidase family protein n=1 Tax=Dokdonella sp. TaxID=2291710 RepID=UPI001B3E4703|nr:pyridoxamine 5'-phosphate oxidase family protein [Dokdonella sp.]MBK8124663.1 pyridoxamine 5'-phosphate oxidase family protein [Dokdonella sp.]MBP6330759.1 pyridoxamine 5'-phosphate oxidase family protein [Dokdonella sp.]HNV08376.1 pyridoxamine 5'-phosphate oxidase family protein [Dokdonella sp.]HQV49885.1 pyridoxamine 5'-phosphate oxidase family protein [Dokdonella sp.]